MSFTLPENSPFELYFSVPYQRFFTPLSDIVYTPIRYLSATFNRPDDQSIYMLASTAALISCLALKRMTDVT